MSVAFAVKSGATMILYCDSIGERLLKHLPYSEIHNVFDNWDIDPRFWASPKMYVYAHESIGSIHIDGDVFIKTEECLNELKFDNFDLIYSHLESSSMGATKYNYDLIESKIHTPVFGKRCINCGIVGFNNRDLIDKYVQDYWYYYKCLLRSGYDYQAKLVCPDLILEQMNLYNIMSTYRYKGKSLFNYASPAGGEHKARKIGFTHLLSENKYNPIVMKRVKDRLLEIAPDIYYKTEKLIKTL